MGKGYNKFKVYRKWLICVVYFPVCLSFCLYGCLILGNSIYSSDYFNIKSCKSRNISREINKKQVTRNH